MNGKQYCIYHSRDLDGWMSGAIAKLAYPNIELIPFDYGWDFQAIYDMVKGVDQVIMVDVSVDIPIMKKLASEVGEFIWVDHHLSKLVDLMPEEEIVINADGWPVAHQVGDIWVYFKNGVSACELMWNLFMPEFRPPTVVQLAGEYDVYRQNDRFGWDNETLPFQYYSRANITSPDDVLAHFFYPSKPEEALRPSDTYYACEDMIQEFIKDGEMIFNYQKVIDRVLCQQNAFEVDWKGKKWICVNNGTMNSISFDSVYEPDRHDGMMYFRYANGQFTFSIYTTHEDVDCSALAKEMGGGGHKKASGFRVPNLALVLGEYPLPSFLYEEHGKILSGAISDADVTSEWNAWIASGK